jgi:hypothetical protein
MPGKKISTQDAALNSSRMPIAVMNGAEFLVSYANQAFCEYQRKPGRRWWASPSQS